MSIIDKFTGFRSNLQDFQAFPTPRVEKKNMNQFLRIALMPMVALVTAPLIALANGGPVDLSTGSPNGILRPVEQSKVQLLSENLSLKLLPDGKSFNARATYTVNAEEALVQGYMVPLEWGMTYGEATTIDQLVENGLARETIAKIEKSVVIKVTAGGTTVAYGCKLDGKVQQKPSKTYMYGDSVEDSQVSYSWCVSTLKLGAGVSTIELSYRGEMEFVDDETSKSTLTNYMPRTLRYDFSPAGYWGANSGFTLNVEMDISEYPGRMLGTLPPFENPARAGGKLRWGPISGDLKNLSSLNAGFTIEKVFTLRDLLKKPAAKAKDLRARATVPSAGDAQPVSNLFDGKTETSWCLQHGTAAEGAVIQIDVEALNGEYGYGRFEGLLFLNGVSKSRELYTRNNRIQQIEVRACGKSAVTKYDFDTEENDYRYAWKLLSLPDDENASGGGDEVSNHKTCVEIKILKIKKGTSEGADTCVGEIVPFLNHG